jgi:DHA2 family multidrug resistance protein
MVYNDTFRHQPVSLGASAFQLDRIRFCLAIAATRPAVASVSRKRCASVVTPAVAHAVKKGRSSEPTAARSSMSTSDVEVELTPRGRIAVALGILPAGMMSGLDTFAVSVALPSMQGALSASLTEISWILTAYLVASAIFTPLYGWLTRRIPRRRLYMIIIVGTIGTSLMVAQSHTLFELVCFRFLQGFFGAGFNPLLMQTVLATFPREHQGTAFGWLTTGRMSGIIVGPVLGGVITEYFNWRLVFLTNLPLGILALLLIYRYVPSGQAEPRKQFDLFGFIFLSLCIGAFQLMLDWGDKEDWFESREIIVLGLLALVTFYVFSIHLITTRNAYLNPRIFRNREFLIGLLFAFLNNFMTFGYAGLIPPILQKHMGYPVLAAGIIMTPRGIGTMVSSLIAGALMLRYPAKPLMATGVICIGLSTAMLSTFTPDIDVWSIMLAIFIQGAGIGFLSVSILAVSFQSMPHSMRPDATSILSLSRRLGSSIGVSVLVAQLAHSTRDARSVLMENVSFYNERLHVLPIPDSWNLDSAQGLLSIQRVVDKQSEFIAYLHDFRLMTVLMVLILPLVFLVRTPSVSTSAAPADAQRGAAM